MSDKNIGIIFIFIFKALLSLLLFHNIHSLLNLSIHLSSPTHFLHKYLYHPSTNLIKIRNIKLVAFYIDPKSHREFMVTLISNNVAVTTLEDDDK